jgi:hypothetical protein
LGTVASLQINKLAERNPCKNVAPAPGMVNEAINQLEATNMPVGFEPCNICPPSVQKAVVFSEITRIVTDQRLPTHRATDVASVG